MRIILCLGLSGLFIGCAGLMRTRHSPQIDYITTRLKDKPHDVQLLMTRGKLYQKQDQFPQSVADYSTVIQIDPNNATAYSERARSHFYGVTNGGNWVGVVAALSRQDPLGISADLDRSLALDPTGGDGSLFYLRAGVRTWQFRDAEAEADLVKYVQHYPQMEKEVRADLAKWRKDRDSVPRERTEQLRQAAYNQ